VLLSATLEKLALLGVINVDPAAQGQALTQSVGDEIGRMIVEQQQLEKRFEELVSAQHELRNQPNKLKLQANEVRCGGRGFEGVDGEVRAEAMANARRI